MDEGNDGCNGSKFVELVDPDSRGNRRVKQNRLIANQNKLLAYIGGLGVAVSTGDENLMAGAQRH